jgi:hypothetical protein
MRILIAVTVVAAVLAGAIGCAPGTSGGPGASNQSSNRTVLGPAEDSFRLDMPNLSTSL